MKVQGTPWEACCSWSAVTGDDTALLPPYLLEKDVSETQRQPSAHPTLSDGHSDRVLTPSQGDLKAEGEQDPPWLVPGRNR